MMMPYPVLQLMPSRQRRRRPITISDDALWELYQQLGSIEKTAAQLNATYSTVRKRLLQSQTEERQLRSQGAQPLHEAPLTDAERSRNYRKRLKQRSSENSASEDADQK